MCSVILPSGERAASVTCSHDKAESHVVAHQETSEFFGRSGDKNSHADDVFLLI